MRSRCRAIASRASGSASRATIHTPPSTSTTASTHRPASCTRPRPRSSRSSAAIRSARPRGSACTRSSGARSPAIAARRRKRRGAPADRDLRQRALLHHHRQWFRRDYRRAEQLDTLVERVFGAPSQDGARPASDEGAGAGPSVEKLLDRHDDLAKITARKGTKPKGGTPSDWDFMLGCRAAEYGYDDEVLGALIRHARAIHNDDKGERDDYVERTIRAVRRRVGQIGAEISYDELFAGLTRALQWTSAAACVLDWRGRAPQRSRSGNRLDDGSRSSSPASSTSPSRRSWPIRSGPIAIVTEFSSYRRAAWRR